MGLLLYLTQPTEINLAGHAVANSGLRSALSTMLNLHGSVRCAASSSGALYTRVFVAATLRGRSRSSAALLTQGRLVATAKTRSAATALLFTSSALRAYARSIGASQAVLYTRIAALGRSQSYAILSGMLSSKAVLTTLLSYELHSVATRCDFLEQRSTAQLQGVVTAWTALGQAAYLELPQVPTYTEDLW